MNVWASQKKKAKSHLRSVPLMFEHAEPAIPVLYKCKPPDMPYDRYWAIRHVLQSIVCTPLGFDLQQDLRSCMLMRRLVSER